jgi:hypothetical protein
VFGDAGGSTWVSDLTAVRVADADDFRRLRRTIAGRRCAAALHDAHSASCVITLLVTSCAPPADGQPEPARLVVELPL